MGKKGDLLIDMYINFNSDKNPKIFFSVTTDWYPVLLNLFIGIHVFYIYVRNYIICIINLLDSSETKKF